MNHKEIIFKGSRSFSLASLFFSRNEKICSWKLYSWCRYCDDLIDEVNDEFVLNQNLQNLRSETSSLIHHRPDNFFMAGMYDVVQEFSLPLKYPMDLLRGMEMDVSGQRFQTLQDLEEYCYCVAGTVGLMMCHILGIRDEVALKHAVSLGNAMQLTNISRDIVEDYRKERLYLPLSWLSEKDIEENELLSQSNQDNLLELQGRLLLRADQLYFHGLDGLRYLSLRSAWAVLIAAMVYSEIGKVIRHNPAKSLKERSVVSTKKKIAIIFKSFFLMVPLIFRQMKLKKVAPPQSIWSMNS